MRHAPLWQAYHPHLTQRTHGVVLPADTDVGVLAVQKGGVGVSALKSSTGIWHAGTVGGYFTYCGQTAWAWKKPVGIDTHEDAFKRVTCKVCLRVLKANGLA